LVTSGQPGFKASRGDVQWKAKGIQILNNRTTGGAYSFIPDGINPIIFSGNVDSTGAALPNFNSAGNGTTQYNL
jgi:hypothetical protein